MNNQIEILKAKLNEKIAEIDRRLKRCEKDVLIDHSEHRERLHSQARGYERVLKMIEELPDPIPSPTTEYLTASISNVDGEIFFAVTGIHGQFDWDELFRFIKTHQDNDGPYEIQNLFKDQIDTTITLKIELQSIPPEYQYNNADSPPFILPGYYDVKTVEVVSRELIPNE